MIRKFLPYIFWLYSLALVIASIIPWSTQTQVGVGLFTFRMDYWLHFFAYLGLTTLFILMKVGQLPKQDKNLAFYKGFSILLFGLFTEVLQLFIPGRNFNFKDLLVNSLAIFLAILFCLIFKGLIYRIVYFELKPYRIRNSDNI